MMSKRILLVAENIGDPCSYYRLLNPFMKLKPPKPQDGMPIHLSLRSQMPYDIRSSESPEVGDIWWADVIVMLRPQTSKDLELIKACKMLQKKVWIDYDDDFTCIPIDHPSHAEYTSAFFQDIFQQILISVDLITVSTDAIQKSLARKTPTPIHVIKNGIDLTLTPIALHNKDSNVFAWRGTSGHHLEALELIEVAKEYGKKIDWVLMGQVPAGLVSALTECAGKVKAYPPMDFFPMLETLRYFKPRTIFSPLFDNPFNKAKSNCLFLEALSVGAITCAPDYIPEFAIPGVLGWDSKTLRTHQSPAIFVEAERTARDNYDLCVLNLKRGSLLESLITA